MKPFGRITAFLCTLALLPGCSSRPYEGKQRIPLKGKVTVDGRPMDAGTISFVPDNVEANRPSGGVILDGQYDVPEPMGANEGSYRVEIHWQKPTGKKSKAIDSDELIEQRREGLPDKYHKNTELKVEIKKDTTEFNFDLSTQ
jgi:hypothetical protein